MKVRFTAGVAVAFTIISLWVETVSADVKPHGLFTNNMVLQQEKPVPVWGTAADGEKVTVTLGDQSANTVAEGGRWKVSLKPLKAGGPHKLVIEGNNKIELDNVLVGEVWLCSGQSNMQWDVNASADPKETIATSENPKIRLFTVPRGGTPEPKSDVQGNWTECGPETVGSFSAVGYHFGAALQDKLGVPVGLISTNVGGTAAERWTSKKVLEADPELKDLAGGNSGDLYNAMIHSLVPFNVRGAIWYQGESNAGKAYQYRTLFPAMIKNWRQDWGQSDMPFLFVQLAPFMKKVDQPQESGWAELREAQLLTMQNVPNTAMAVITDVGDEADIHPKAKKPVGQRLALAARALAYGEDIEYSGPIYESMVASGNQAIVSFNHVGKGLMVQGDKPTGFTIAGEDKKFHNAQAEIKGDTVVVFSEHVEKPIAVRYGWADFPLGNLANKDGLLASPFRTDDFPGVTGGKKQVESRSPAK